MLDGRRAAGAGRGSSQPQPRLPTGRCALGGGRAVASKRSLRAALDEALLRRAPRWSPGRRGASARQGRSARRLRSRSAPLGGCDRCRADVSRLEVNLNTADWRPPRALTSTRSELAWSLRVDSHHGRSRYLALIHGILKRAERVYGLLPTRRPASIDRRCGGRTTSTSFRGGGGALGRARPRTRRSILTAAYAGLRLGELRALRWPDADYAKRLIHFRRYYGRARRGPQTTPLPRICRSARYADLGEEVLLRASWGVGLSA